MDVKMMREPTEGIYLSCYSDICDVYFCFLHKLQNGH